MDSIVLVVADATSDYGDEVYFASGLVGGDGGDGRGDCTLDVLCQLVTNMRLSWDKSSKCRWVLQNSYAVCALRVHWTSLKAWGASKLQVTLSGIFSVLYGKVTPGFLFQSALFILCNISTN